jgi:hypothetical protein
VKEQSEIDRLDLVARAEATKVAISRARLPITILSLFFVFLAVISGASFNETLAARLLAALAVVAAVLLWQDSRFAVYGIAVLFFALLVGVWLPWDDPDFHTFFGSTERDAISAMICFAGYRWWTNAMPFIAAQSKSFDNERSKVMEWIKMLNSSNESNQLIEFSVKSFFHGYWTYRLLYTGSCWATAKFKTGKMHRILDLRVLGSDAIHVREQPQGQLSVQMANRLIHEVEISNVMRDRLLHSMSVKS